MSNSFIGKDKSTSAAKMAKISGSAKNYEHAEDKAKRIAKVGSNVDGMSDEKANK